jgi:hypothetical protein
VLNTARLVSLSSLPHHPSQCRLSSVKHHAAYIVFVSPLVLVVLCLKPSTHPFASSLAHRLPLCDPGYHLCPSSRQSTLECKLSTLDLNSQCSTLDTRIISRCCPIWFGATLSQTMVAQRAHYAAQLDPDNCLSLRRHLDPASHGSQLPNDRHSRVHVWG